MARWIAARREALLLLLILAAGAAFRLHGLDWDDGQWLHPDERQIYFVTDDLAWPRSVAEALSPDSPLNPKFFAYGSLPLYLLKLVAALLKPLWPALRLPGNLHLAGRPLAVLFDLGTVYLTYLLARKLWRPVQFSPSPRPSPKGGELAPSPPGGERVGVRGEISEKAKWDGLFAAVVVSLAVLHIQLARFYTADPLLTFLVMMTLNLAADVAQGAGRRRQVALGVVLGLALATKVSAAPLLLVVLIAYHTRSTRHKAQGARPKRLIAQLPMIAFTLALAAAVFFLAQPYALIDWWTFVDHTLRESEIARGVRDVPYTLQYAGTLPFVYSMWQTALWGLGLPLGLAAWAGLAALLVRWLRRAAWTDALLLAWAGPYFAASALLYTRYLRYMLPLAPILCILAVQLLAGLKPRRVRVIGYWVLGIGSLGYALAFVSIYAQPHSWLTASEWIYREAPRSSTLAVEYWDMALPLPLEMKERSRRQSEYDMRILSLYDEPDDSAKWGSLVADLADSDYLIIASRRLYGSIPRVPDRYPVASRYYEQLFAGNLGFALEHEFARGPAWLNPRLPPLPDPAPAWLIPDESFVVYDHPRALIFHNVERLSAEELLRRLAAR